MLRARQWTKHRRYVRLFASFVDDGCGNDDLWFLVPDGATNPGFDASSNGSRQTDSNSDDDLAHGFDASSNGSGQNDRNWDDDLAPEVWDVDSGSILMAKQKIFTRRPSKASIMFLFTFYCFSNSAITCLTEDFDTWIWLHPFCIG